MTKTALTVAGFDPDGGAGLQADLKVFHTLKVHGLSVVSAVTAQNSRGVAAVEAVSPEMFRRQLKILLDDIVPDALKTGVLYDAVTVLTLTEIVAARGLQNLVIDPVMLPTQGARLMRSEAAAALISGLIPLAAFVTPNAAEAAALTGMEVQTPRDMCEAARRIAGMGAACVVVTGGDMAGNPNEDSAGASLDIFFDGARCHELVSPKIPGRFHGTGCVFSASLTAALALGYSAVRAVEFAKSFTRTAIENSYRPGKGMSFLNV
jgi:hydroxymethylpyrimidine/phosphomethylpyrimidine kinase